MQHIHDRWQVGHGHHLLRSLALHPSCCPVSSTTTCWSRGSRVARCNSCSRHWNSACVMTTRLSIHVSYHWLKTCSTSVFFHIWTPFQVESKFQKAYEKGMPKRVCLEFILQPNCVMCLNVGFHIATHWQLLFEPTYEDCLNMIAWLPHIATWTCYQLNEDFVESLWMVLDFISIHLLCSIKDFQGREKNSSW
jgi:hypothetical protein